MKPNSISTCYVNWFWVAFTTQDGQGDDPTHRGSGMFDGYKLAFFAKK